jgi:hypothetical protein
MRNVQRIIESCGGFETLKQRPIRLEVAGYMRPVIESFARHIGEHLKLADKQAMSQSSRFLDNCHRFNRGELSEEELTEVTVRLGFNNVIDAFHIVGNQELGVRFFADEQATPAKAIRLTDDAFRLTEVYQHRNLKPRASPHRFQQVNCCSLDCSFPT